MSCWAHEYPGDSVKSQSKFSAQTFVRANLRNKTKTPQQRPNVGFMKVLGLALQLGSSCNNKNKYRISGTEHSVNAEACPMLYQTTNTAKVRPSSTRRNCCMRYQLNLFFFWLKIPNRGRFNRPRGHPRRIFWIVQEKSVEQLPKFCCPHRRFFSGAGLSLLNATPSASRLKLMKCYKNMN